MKNGSLGVSISQRESEQQKRIKILDTKKKEIPRDRASEEEESLLHNVAVLCFAGRPQ